MQSIRHILSLILVAALLCSGLPLFDFEDANRDTRVDLQDAILHMKGFSDAADRPENFISQVEGAISTLHILAGIKADLRPAGDQKFKAAGVSPKLLYIPTTIDSAFYSETFCKITEPNFLYQSLSFKPETPPPKRLFARAS